MTEQRSRPDPSPRALVVDDEPDIRELLGITLGRMNIEVTTAGDYATAVRQLGSERFDLVLTDMRLPDGDGLDLVEWIQAHRPGLPVAVITAHGNVEAAVRALKLGAFDFISKPLDLAALRKLITATLKLGASVEATGRRATLRLLGDSRPMQQLRLMIAKVARSQAPVHISGDSGTGKELAARLIHESGPRADGPFVPVNCGAIPSELMESELFGHKKGSFTGAVADKDGLIRSAEGGTLFLDEVADLPLHMQVKLLRVIQEKAVRPVGETREVPVDVRILSATHRKLEELVKAGRFREDLYYRINVIELHVPALRERLDDVPQLVDMMLARVSRHIGVSQPDITDEAMDKLLAYPYPGNVRELENILERAVTLCSNDRVQPEDIQLKQGVTLELPPVSDEAGADGLDVLGEEAGDRMNQHALNTGSPEAKSIESPLAVSGPHPDISVVIGTKAQYIKTAPLLRELTSRGIAYRLIDTGQHAALSSRLRGELGVKEPDICLGDSSNVKTVSQAAGWAVRILALTAFRPAYVRQVVFRPGPGFCVIHGDTPSTLLALLMAKRAGKRVVHLEAGLRSFRLLRPFPEELIRIVCMHFSDVLFAPSKWAHQNLRSMRVRGHCVELPQNTNVEAMYFALQHGDRSLVPGEPYALMTVHRVETILSRRRLAQVVELACELARERLVLFVLHDPTINKLRDFGLLARLEQCRGLRTTPLLLHSQFLPLLAEADFVVTDGGSIQEESHYLDVPCIVVRKETERMEGVGSNVHLAGFDLEAIRALIRQFGARRDRRPVDNHEPSRDIADVLLDGSLLRGARGPTARPRAGT